MSVATEMVERKRRPNDFTLCYRCGQRKEVRTPKPGVLCTECRTSDTSYILLAGLVPAHQRSRIDWGLVIEQNYEWIQARRGLTKT